MNIECSDNRQRRAMNRISRIRSRLIMVGLAIGVLTFSPRWCEEVQATEPETPALDELIKGLSQEVSRYMQALQAQAKKAADYSAAVLWAVFISSSLGLIMTITGDRLGAQAGIRIYRRSVI